MFDSLPIRDARPIALMKTGMRIVVALFCVIATVSGYRAYFQVRSLELNSAGRVLHSGSVIQTNVVISARTHVDMRIELIQGAHSETLAVQLVRGNYFAFFDPRPQRASQTVLLTAALLGRFQTGPAQIRATATGRPQWGRLPPPTVRELAVEIQHD